MIKGFKSFNEDNELAISINNIIEYQHFSKMKFESLNEESLSEFKLPNIDKLLNEEGYRIKQGHKFIQIVASSGEHFSRIIHSAINESKELEELLSKKIKKENVVDFLLKLDNVTLHTITKPIMKIESITGWNIIEEIHKVRNTSETEESIKEVNAKLKSTLEKLGNTK